MLTIPLLQRFVRRRASAFEKQNPLLEFESEVAKGPSAAEAATTEQPRRRAFLHRAGMVILAIAVVAAGTQWRSVAGLMRSPVPPQPASVAVRTQPPGAQVLVNGEPRGVTPLTLQLPAGTYALVIRNDQAERAMTLTAAAGADIVREIEFASAVAGPAAAPAAKVAASPDANQPPGEKPAAAGMAGWLSVHSPFELQVVEGGDVVGSSSLSRIMLPAGRRDLEFINEKLDFVERRPIQIAAGKTAAISFAAPQVAININARPWADVSVDGVALGQTPIANAMMAIGSRQLVFRHPELGERRHDVVITTRPSQRISIDLTK